MLAVRAAELQDLPGIYRVCLETGDPNHDAGTDGRNPDLLGHVYAGPYVVLEPALARAVVDEHGVAGYLFGCLDTVAFAERAEREWWPLLRTQYPVERAGAPDRDLIELLHHPPMPPEGVLERFPSHLHIDLLPRARGLGLGRVLIDWLRIELRRAGSPGVHLGVGSDNANAIDFYRHLGFTIHEVDGDTTWMIQPFGS